MGELMRSNKVTSIQNAETANPYLISSMTVTSPGCGYPTSTAGCANAEETAQRDVYEWLTRVDSELPGARVVICQDATPQDAGGLPQWTCSNSGGVMVIKIGWTRANTLKGATGTDATSTTGVNEGAFDKALRPAVIFPVIAGSST